MKWPAIKMGSSSSTGDGNSEAEATRDLEAIEKLIGSLRYRAGRLSELV